MLGPKSYSTAMDKPIVDPTGEILHVVLSNLVMLSIKAKNFHWNVTGPGFYGDHKTYDDIYTGAIDYIDTIGERLRALQIKVNATLSFFDKTNIIDDGDEEANPAEMKEDMLESLEAFCTHICGAMMATDPTTSNILQEVDAWAGKMAFFVRSSK